VKEIELTKCPILNCLSCRAPRRRPTRAVDRAPLCTFMTRYSINQYNVCVSAATRFDNCCGVNATHGEIGARFPKRRSALADSGKQETRYVSHVPNWCARLCVISRSSLQMSRWHAISIWSFHTINKHRRGADDGRMKLFSVVGRNNFLEMCFRPSVIALIDASAEIANLACTYPA
jgi:hypothetical protein